MEIAAADIATLRSNAAAHIAEGAKLNPDLASLYQADADHLTYIADELTDGNVSYARHGAAWLDSVVRDLIPSPIRKALGC